MNALDKVAAAVTDFRERRSSMFDAAWQLKPGYTTEQAERFYSDFGQKAAALLPELLDHLALNRPRIDVTVHIDSDGNPSTSVFLDGVKLDASLLRNIHEHTIDGGRSGEDHEWACSMYEQATNPALPKAVRAEFASALAHTHHDCTSEWEKCESCENCGDGLCPVITAANSTEETSK
ncbi:hypothetical protein QCN29_15040 [Streptomyces sp. HNM0663]|uniref:Uncharacterized protein n=1 Tax=Streptomyces chengmaiensis TaxID=3040919 RepID=A0ABT6HN21_9ACTN|nr:hypothetical protein [Streptomyces chengmaiensis]MDH2390083.1 hypothetical protein [Streptomyces chengmaiensis]